LLAVSLGPFSLFISHPFVFTVPWHLLSEIRVITAAVHYNSAAYKGIWNMPRSRNWVCALLRKFFYSASPNNCKNLQQVNNRRFSRQLSLLLSAE